MIRNCEECNIPTALLMPVFDAVFLTTNTMHGTIPPKKYLCDVCYSMYKAVAARPYFVALEKEARSLKQRLFGEAQ